METIDEHPGRCSTKATKTVTETQKLLSTLGHGYKRAKAQQILRLLKDQESLNQRFKDCALDERDEEEENSKNNEVTKETDSLNDVDQEEDVQGNKNNGNNKRSVGWKKSLKNVDPSRCRTSMGFYNAAECSNSIDEEIDVEAAENADLELDVGAEADMSFDELEPTMTRLAMAANHGGNRRRLFRLQLNEDEEFVQEEGFSQSAKSSRPKTGITSGSARSKQYRRPSQTDPMGRSAGNNMVSTSISKLDGPFTPRGGVKGFCDGQKTPRDDPVACLTPRQSDLKLCLTPRQDSSYQSRNTLNEFAGYFTPRSHDVNNTYTPRQNDIGNCYTPRQNDPCSSYTPRHNDGNTSYTPRHNNESVFYTPRPFDLNGNGKFTSRHNDTNGCLTPRQSELYFNSRLDEITHTMTPRPSHQVQRGVRGLQDNPLSPREDSTLLGTPRRDDISGGITPRSYNIISGPFNSHHTPAVSNSMRNGRQVEKSLFEMSPSFSNEPSRSKRQHGNMGSKIMSTTDNGNGKGKRNAQLTPRTVLSVDNSPIQLVPAGALEGEVTPRRQKPESKGKKRGDIQRIGGHQNLNKLSERVRPIAVMKLPPLDVAINKPVVS